MTFEQFYNKVIEISGIQASERFVRILWDEAYTIEQAVHSLQTMNDI